MFSRFGDPVTVFLGARVANETPVEPTRSYQVISYPELLSTLGTLPFVTFFQARLLFPSVLGFGLCYLLLERPHSILIANKHLDSAPVTNNVWFAFLALTNPQSFPTQWARE